MPFSMSGIRIEAAIEYQGKIIKLDDSVNEQDSVVRAILQSIASVEVDVQMGQLSQMRLQLTPTYDDAIKIVKSGLLGMGIVPGGEQTGDAAEQRVLRLRFGYDDDSDLGISPWFVGGMTVPEMDFGEEITLTMIAHSALFFGQRMESLNVEPEKVEITEFLQTIADKFDIEIVILDSTAEGILSEKLDLCTALDPFSALRDVLYKHGMSFYCFTASGEEAKDQVVIFSVAGRNAVLPKWQFVMYGQINPNMGVFPIERISFNPTPLMVPGSTFGAKTLVIDSSSKEELIDEDASDYDLSKQPLVGEKVSVTSMGNAKVSSGLPKTQKSKSGGGLADVDTASDAGMIVASTKRGDDLDTRGESQSQVMFAGDQALQFTISGPGVPMLSPTDLVNIQIAGLPEISGNASILVMRHRLDSSGFSTELVLSRALAVASGGDDVDTNVKKFIKGEGKGVMTITPKSL